MNRKKIISKVIQILFPKELIPGGMGDGKPDSKYNPKELDMGIDVEMEHTFNPDMAKEIAKDHLTEIADYYTRLKKMEEDAGID